MPTPTPAATRPVHLCLAAAGLVAAAAAQSQYECDLFVTEEAPARAWTFHAITGAPTGLPFATQATPRNFMAIHHGTVAQPVLVGSRGYGVFEFDRNTGAYLKTYNPGGGWQWAGVFAANGDVLIGDMTTDDVRRYDATSGGYLGTFAPNVIDPADMTFGPNGNLFVCSYGSPLGGVYELHGVTGALVAHHVATLEYCNDIVFMPDGRRIVTSMQTNQAHVFDPGWTQLTTFAGTGWQRPHGIDVSPYDGHIYAADGVTQAVHRFHPTTYTETHAAFAFVEGKIVDVEFRRGGTPTCGNVIVIAPGCGGLQIEHTGRPQTGSMLTLRVRGARPSVPASLTVGDSRTHWSGLPLPIPLGAFGAPGCSVLTSPLVFLPGAVGPQGSAELPLRLPPDRGLVGATIFFQWLVLDRLVNSMGLATAAAFEVRIGG